ncbi:hypothetical protein QQF64_015199 [Cirrhinus molitorella]|uniref:Ig-like domain-containing protein n=1 Tax=Cirrhinus molitorella TaxID=172907 RepID=A0ABR3NUK4_9TELE
MLHSVILLSAFAYATYGNDIKPAKTEEMVDEGSSVKLSCSYSSAYYLHWYRQYPGSAPEFIVLISDSAKQAKESNLDSRFTTKVTKGIENQVDLEISTASISDSALYYCALEPTVTRNTRNLNSEHHNHHNQRTEEHQQNGSDLANMDRHMVLFLIMTSGAMAADQIGPNKDSNHRTLCAGGKTELNSKRKR